MFDFFKKKKSSEIMIGAPAKGKAVPLKEVNDPTFSQGMLGEGVAVCPSDGRIYAPADGTIGMVFDTLHAASLTTPDGVEVLIHVGLDTVKLGGDGFKGHVKAGDAVKKGDLLLEADLSKIKEAGYDDVIVMIICNTADYASVTGFSGKDVEPGDDILTIQKK